MKMNSTLIILFIIYKPSYLRILRKFLIGFQLLFQVLHFLQFALDQLHLNYLKSLFWIYNFDDIFIIYKIIILSNTIE